MALFLCHHIGHHRSVHDQASLLRKSPLHETDEMPCWLRRRGAFHDIPTAARRRWGRSDPLTLTDTVRWGLESWTRLILYRPVTMTISWKSVYTHTDGRSDRRGQWTWSRRFSVGKIPLSSAAVFSTFLFIQKKKKKKNLDDDNL